MIKLGSGRKIVFLIIPLILLGFTYNRKLEFWKGMADPAYTYLLNGSNLAYEHGNVGLYQHPGSTVTAFSAALIQITYKVRDTENNMREDVLLHPETYIKVIVWTFSIINCLLVLFLGIVLFKLTNNLSYGILFQSISILSGLALNTFYSLGPDPLLFGSVLLFVTVFLSKFYYDKTWGEISMNYQSAKRTVSILNIDGLVICLGIIMGFCFATKLNCMPLVLLPLLFVYKKNLFSFFGVTFLSFIFFTLPIASHYDDLLLWVKNIFTHSGNYGSGDARFMNWAQLPEKMNMFIKHEPILIFIFLLSIGVLIRLLIQKNYGIQFKILASVVLVQLGGLVMILKHFEIRYFLPVYVTLIINLIIIFDLLNLADKIKKAAIYLFVFVSFSFAYYQMNDENNTFSKLYSPGKTIVKKEHINIYSEGCYSKEYALKFGDFFANNANAEVLQKLYGNQYFFIIWEQQLYDWKGPVDFNSLFNLNKKIYFYASDRFVKTYNFPFKLTRISSGKYLLEKDVEDSNITHK